MDDFTKDRCPPPSLKYLNTELAEFDSKLKSFLANMNVPYGQVKTDRDIVNEINSRVHQRINYYLFFHGKTLQQSRQVAIRSYWILRHRPIRLLASGSWNRDYDINVYFAFYLMFTQIIGELFAVCPKNIQATAANNILNKYKDDYIRAFSEYDISKEAMMVLSESLKSIVKCEIMELQNPKR